jgi:putative flippase GtrA
MTSTLTAPSLRQSLLRFVVVGGLSVGTDLALLALLRSGVHAPLWLATVVAYAASLVVNYSLNHSWVFASEREHHRAIARYFTLVAFNVGSTLGLVLGLTAAGLFYLMAKLIAVAVNAVVNFVGFRFWVFG